METNIITQVLLPLALFIIMMGMGLSLVMDDFRRVFRYPKAVAVGLGIKLVVMPLVTFALLALFPLEPQLAVGFILLAACPGGATTNLITNLAKGDVALSITLTAIASVITVFTIPILVNLGLQHYIGQTMEIHLPFGKTVAQILAITVVPVMLGMLLNNRIPALAHKAEQPVKMISAIFLVLIIGAALIKERANAVEFFSESWAHCACAQPSWHGDWLLGHAPVYGQQATGHYRRHRGGRGKRHIGHCHSFGHYGQFGNVAALGHL